MNIKSLFQLIPDGVPAPIMRGPLAGNLWLTGAAAGEGKGLSVLINHAEPLMLQKAKSLARQGGVVFDVGANVGLYTLLFAHAKAAVYSFEPVPRNLSYLWRHLRWNRYPTDKIIACAVSGSDNFQLFDFGDNCAVGHLSADGAIPVATITLDTFCAKMRTFPDLVKIDVEGSEVDVLRGGTAIFTSRHPSILLSTHSEELTKTTHEILRSYGYRKFECLNTVDESEWLIEH